MNNDFLLKISNENKDLIFCVASHEFKYMAHNWFLHLKKINLNDQSIVICLDFNILNYLKNNNINCIYYTECITGDLKINNLKNISPSNYVTILTLIFENLFKYYNFNVIYSDVDMIFLKNPISYFYEILDDDGDCCIFRDIYFKGSIYKSDYFNGETIFFKKSSYIKIKNVLEKQTSKINLFDLSFDSYKEIFNLNIKPLNRYKFVHSSFLNCNPIKDIISKNAYCVHYSDIDKDHYEFDINKILNDYIQKKINDMKKNNHWII
jgi:hypothetical protein